MRLSTKLNFRWMQKWASGLDGQTSSHLPPVNNAGRREGRRQTEDSLGTSSFDWRRAPPTTASWERRLQATTALKLKGEPGLYPRPDKELQTNRTLLLCLWLGTLSVRCSLSLLPLRIRAKSVCEFNVQTGE